MENANADAGNQKDTALVDMSLAAWNAVIGVNLTGRFLCAREVVREFLRRGPGPEVSRAAGKIICISSVHEQIHGPAPMTQRTGCRAADLQRTICCYIAYSELARRASAGHRRPGPAARQDTFSLVGDDLKWNKLKSRDRCCSSLAIGQSASRRHTPAAPMA
ncbi:MAG: SDR family NAD(P)-dependent oxidoreductase [Burkholderiales bacterium]